MHHSQDKPKCMLHRKITNSWNKWIWKSIVIVFLGINTSGTYFSPCQHIDGADCDTAITTIPNQSFLPQSSFYVYSHRLRQKTAYLMLHIGFVTGKSVPLLMCAVNPMLKLSMKIIGPSESFLKRLSTLLAVICLAVAILPTNVYSISDCRQGWQKVPPPHEDENSFSRSKKLQYTLSTFYKRKLLCLGKVLGTFY